SNRYSVRPLPSTRTIPSLLLAAVTVATPDRPLPVGLLVPPEPPEPYPPEPEPLAHPAANGPTPPRATSASSGRRGTPSLLGRDRESGGSGAPLGGSAGCPAGSPGLTEARW